MFKYIKKLLFKDNKDAQKIKNKYTTEMLNIHTKAKAQVVSSQKTVRMIEKSTAYRVACAVGGIK